MESGYVGAVTVTGLVIVFVALLLLIIAVALMNKIFDIIEEQKKAETEAAAPAKAPVEAVPAPVREMPVIEQSTEDDTEVIVVIAAAVAHIAAESGKELKVRSIRQTSGRRASRGSWAAAAVSDSMRSVS